MLRSKRGLLSMALIAGMGLSLLGAAGIANAQLTGDSFSNRNAAYLSLGAGARALGMGGAFVGVADDATAAYWNPAGLTWTSGWEVTGMYTAGMNVDRQHNYVAFSRNGGMGAYALQWINAGMSDIQGRNEVGDPVGGLSDFGDNAVSLSLAKAYDVFSAGITGKYLRQSFSTGDRSNSGFGIDLGTGLILSDYARLGISVQNVAGKLGSKDASDESKTIPATLRAGVGVMPMEGLTAAFDVEKTRDDEDYRFHAGAEYAVAVSDEIGAAFRMGLNHDKFAGGLGVRFNFLTFDYAYVVEPEKFLDENHRLSVSLNFGREDHPMRATSGDRDGDGIPDATDQCPDLAEDYDGFADNDGCPDLDNDGDGIPDANDDCPNQPEDFDGYQDTDGCPDPDNDGDGILDKDDKCPNQAEDMNGYQDSDGCPDGGASNPAIPALAYINFKFNTAEISGADPVPILEDVARIMKERPSLRLKITGHTDNVGSDEYNSTLSLRRAEAVKGYLVGRGVDDSRFTIEGKGEGAPLDTNDTDLGRARNRRIEFSIMQ